MMISIIHFIRPTTSHRLTHSNRVTHLIPHTQSDDKSQNLRRISHASPLYRHSVRPSFGGSNGHECAFLRAQHQFIFPWNDTVGAPQRSNNVRIRKFIWRWLCAAHNLHNVGIYVGVRCACMFAMPNPYIFINSYLQSHLCYILAEPEPCRSTVTHERAKIAGGQTTFRSVQCTHAFCVPTLPNFGRPQFGEANAKIERGCCLR